MADVHKTATPKEMRNLVAATRTDDPAWFTYGDRTLTPAELIEILGAHLTAERRRKIAHIVASRTQSLAVVVEGMVDVGNVAAVMRTADGFGIQAIHSIDTADTYKRSKRTTQGADKWIDRYRWESAPVCYEHLRNSGFRIVACTVHPDATPMDAIDLTPPTALVFGNELEGLSNDAIEGADATLVVPMYGFTESFNISVAAAIILREAVRQRIETFGQLGDLDSATAERITAVWYAKSVAKSRAVVKHHLKSDH
jgi:tRNA (guanosine-2'-O-)-methyltransferase